MRWHFELVFKIWGYRLQVRAEVTLMTRRWTRRSLLWSRLKMVEICWGTAWVYSCPNPSSVQWSWDLPLGCDQWLARPGVAHAPLDTVIFGGPFPCNQIWFYAYLNSMRSSLFSFPLGSMVLSKLPSWQLEKFWVIMVLRLLATNLPLH